MREIVRIPRYDVLSMIVAGYIATAAVILLLLTQSINQHGGVVV